jgi:hypothetical protein
VLRLAAPLAIVSAALAMAAGCGGDGGGGGGQTGGADVAPATAALFLALNTDFEGDQWQTAVDLVDRFPAGREALDTFRQDLEEQEDVDFEQDVRPALGPEVALVLLGFEDEDAVLMTQPEDEEKLQALVEKSEGAVAEEIDGWWVVAESQEILDRFKDARGDDSLADTEAFDRTTGALPDETLATLYVNGEQLTPLLEASGTSEEEMAALECSLGDAGIPSMAFSLGAEDDGARLSGAIRAQNLAVPEEGGAELAGEVAGGALVFASFRGLGDQLRGTLRCLREADEEFNEQLGQAELFLGVSVEEDILPLFEEETAIVVYPPSEDAAAEATELPFEIPTAALVTQVEDEAEALETADELAEQAASLADGAEVEELDIGGVEARRVETGEVDVYYAAFDGKLVVATNEEGIEAAQGGGESLSDDEDYAGAREAAGPPDETTGFWYADLADGVDYVLDIYSETEGEDVPAEVEESLEPLRSLFLWTETEGDDVYSFEGFLEIE